MNMKEWWHKVALTKASTFKGEASPGFAGRPKAWALCMQMNNVIQTIWLLMFAIPASLIGHLVGYGIATANKEHIRRHFVLRITSTLVISFACFAVFGTLKSIYTIPSGWSFAPSALAVLLFAIFVWVGMRSQRK